MTDYFADDPRTNRERMLDGDLYIADDPTNERLAQRAVQLTDRYHRMEVACPSSGREVLTSLVGGLGDGAYVKPPLFVDYGENIFIGARSFVNYNLTALDVARITIGDDCLLGPNVQLLTPTHPIEAQPRRDKLEAAQPITLGNNVWIGGGAIVCPGVTVGDNSVIGAGSVVVRDIPANVVAVGNPARVVRAVT